MRPRPLQSSIFERLRDQKLRFHVDFSKLPSDSAQASKHPRWGRRNARSVPPPHRRWRRVLNPKSKSWPNIYQAQIAQLQKPRPRSPDYPLSISPPGSAHSAGPAQNLRRTSGGRSFFRFFAFPKRLPKFASENHRKKCENRGFWPPQTLPKPSPKPFKIEASKTFNFWNPFLQNLMFVEPLKP